MRVAAAVLVVLFWTPVAHGASSPGFSKSAPTPASCVGDCNADQDVTANDLLTMVNIALGNIDVSLCTPGDTNRDHQITIDEILVVVNKALDACGRGGATPTPTPTIGFTYHLLPAYAPSLFTYLTPGAPREDVLSGAFVAVPSELGSDDAFLHFLISSIYIHGNDVGAPEIGPGMGDISASTTTGQLVMTVTFSINGQEVQLSGEVPLASDVLSAQYPPIFFHLEACGAPGRAVRCEDLTAGRDTGYEIRLAAAPGATYQLTTGSTILFATLTPGPSPPTPLPLSGSFEAVQGPPLQADSLFRFILTKIQFESSAFTITGSTGDLEAVPATIELTMSVSINGQQVDLGGGAPLSVASDPLVTYPPIYSGLTACGGGYSLTLFAAPVR